MYLTNRDRRVIHIQYNGKSVTKVYYDRPGTIQTRFYLSCVYFGGLIVNNKTKSACLFIGYVFFVLFCFVLF